MLSSFNNSTAQVISCSVIRDKVIRGQVITPIVSRFFPSQVLKQRAFVDPFAMLYIEAEQ